MVSGRQAGKRPPGDDLFAGTNARKHDRPVPVGRRCGHFGLAETVCTFADQHITTLFLLQNRGSRNQHRFGNRIGQLHRAVHIRFHPMVTVVALDQHLDRARLGIEQFADVVNRSFDRNVGHRRQAYLDLRKSLDQPDILLLDMRDDPHLAQVGDQGQRTGVLFDILAQHDIVLHDLARNRRTHHQRLAEHHRPGVDLVHFQRRNGIFIIFLFQLVVDLGLLDLLLHADVVLQQVFFTVQAFERELHLLLGLVIGLARVEERRRADFENGTALHDFLSEANERLDDTSGERRRDFGIAGRDRLHHARSGERRAVGRGSHFTGSETLQNGGAGRHGDNIVVDAHLRCGRLSRFGGACTCAHRTRQQEDYNSFHKVSWLSFSRRTSLGIGPDHQRLKRLRPFADQSHKTAVRLDK